jgi:hypothetical protein
MYALINRKARSAFKHRNVLLSGDQLHAVDLLKANGTFCSTVEDLTGDRELYGLLVDQAAKMVAGPYMAQQIRKRQDALGFKWYVIRGLGRRNRQILPGPYATLFLNPRLLEVINEYLGLQCRLNYVDLWYNLPVQSHEAAVSSEAWHRDHEDRHVIKVFVYLTDIDANMGPITFLEGTQYQGTYGDLFPAKPAQGAYPDSDKLAEQVLRLGITIHESTGVGGSVVIADTSGLHKGGRTETDPRIVLVGFYTSDAGLDASSYRLSDEDINRSLTPTQRFALRLPPD